MSGAGTNDAIDLEADLWWWREQTVRAAAGTAQIGATAARVAPADRTRMEVRRMQGKRTRLVSVTNNDLRIHTRTPAGRWLIHQQVNVLALQPKYHRMVAAAFWIMAFTAGVCAVGVVGVAGNGSKLFLIVAAVLATVAAVAIGRYRWTERRDRQIAADVAATKAVGAAAGVKALERASEGRVYKTAVHEWWNRRNPNGSDTRIARLRRQTKSGERA